MLAMKATLNQYADVVRNEEGNIWDIVRGRYHMTLRGWESVMPHNDIMLIEENLYSPYTQKVKRYVGQLMEEDEGIRVVGQLHSTKAGG